MDSLLSPLPKLVRSVDPNPMDPDWLLQSIVDMVNESDPASIVHVTLVVGSAWISGVIVSGKEYFQRLAAGVRDQGEQVATPGTIQFAEWLENEGAKVYGRSSGDKKPDFLHLEVMSVWGSGVSSATLNPPHLARIRLSTVTGFLLGKMLSPTYTP